MQNSFGRQAVDFETWCSTLEVAVIRKLGTNVYVEESVVSRHLRLISAFPSSEERCRSWRMSRTVSWFVFRGHYFSFRLKHACHGLLIRLPLVEEDGSEIIVQVTGWKQHEFRRSPSTRRRNLNPWIKPAGVQQVEISEVGD